jgi:RNA polymerase primary sigma factor
MPLEDTLSEIDEELFSDLKVEDIEELLSASDDEDVLPGLEWDEDDDDDAVPLSARIASDDALSLYFNQIGQMPLLSADEEVALAQRIEAGKEAEARLAEEDDLSLEEERRLREQIDGAEDARATFIQANTRLVVSVAKKYRNYGLPFQDLIQAGNIGLIKAVDKFDYEMGNRFSTYAMWWIRQSIKRALTRQGYTIRLPYYLRSRIRRFHKASQALEKRLGRTPTAEEIADELNVDDPKRIERLMQISQHALSLNMPVGEEGDSELVNLLEDEETPSPDETVQQHLMQEDLDEVMTDVLSEREIHILLCRFGLKGNRRHTLQELADELEISRERVRQIERKALRKLRHPYHRRKLLEYLH